MSKSSHEIAAWLVIFTAIGLSFSIAVYSVIFPDSIGKKGMSDDLIIIGLIFDITGVTVVLIPELANKVKRIGKKGNEAIAVVASQKVGSVEKYQYLARGFFLLVIGFTFQIFGNLLSN
ncbi:MAG: hypothetical protein WD512_09310 [Candidatus Paceibacterota bacterium]